MKKLLPIILLALSGTAFAADFNNSHVSPDAARNAGSCPIISKNESHVGCFVDNTVCRSDNSYWALKYRFNRLTLNDYFVSHMCYRPSCYYQAAAFVNENYPLQPLNSDTSVILNVINGGITLPKLTGSNMGMFGSKGRILNITVPNQNTVGGYLNGKKLPPISPPARVQDGLGFTPVASGTKLSGDTTINGHFQTPPPPEPPRYSGPKLPGSNFMAPTPEDMKNIEPGAGTSAFEGLLWSWRMVSNNWRTYWGIRSNYELASDPSIAKRQTELPNSIYLKNIIIISDGADTDGTVSGGLGGGVNTIDNRVINESGFGEKLPATATTLTRETCDAHAPLPAISDADYQNLCDKLYEQGIRVHVIYFGYSGGLDNQRLGYCAKRTRGLAFNNQIDLVQAFREIFATIAAQNVRIVK